MNGIYLGGRYDLLLVSFTSKEATIRVGDDYEIAGLANLPAYPFAEWRPRLIVERTAESWERQIAEWRRELAGELATTGNTAEYWWGATATQDHTPLPYNPHP